MSNKPPFYAQLAIGPAFLGARAQRLANLIADQGDEFFQAVGIVVPVRLVSTILYLQHRGPASLVQIAKGLDEAHQLTAKRTAMLESLAMASCKDDPNDRRRRVFHLTRKGKREAKLIEARCHDALQVFESLNRQLDVHLADALDAAYQALLSKPMLARSIDASIVEEHD